MRRSLVAMALLTFAACGVDHDREAIALFADFQQQLRSGNVEAARRLVTRDSVRVVAAVDPAVVAARKPVVPLRAERHGCQHWITAFDPNDESHATYVVTRQNGRLVVDLLATAEHHARTVPVAEEARYTPVELTPEQVEAAMRRLPAGKR